MLLSYRRRYEHGPAFILLGPHSHFDPPADPSDVGQHTVVFREETTHFDPPDGQTTPHTTPLERHTYEYMLYRCV